MLIFLWLSFCLTLFFPHLGDVASASETKRHRADRFGHEAHGDLVPTIPHCLDGLADIPVVMGHADVLSAREKQEVVGDTLTKAQEAVSQREFERFSPTMKGVWCPRARKRSPKPCRMFIMPEKHNRVRVKTLDSAFA